jgi:farnesyl-diphosphate farnesyltransferase
VRAGGENDRPAKSEAGFLLADQERYALDSALKTSPIVSPELFALLKTVSRSFYLSVRFLPKRIRQTIALAYLLARASDTIADTNRLAADRRLQVLANLSGSIAKGGDPGDLSECVAAQADGSEKTLLDKVPLLCRKVGELPESHRALVREVLAKIIHGQTLDIERFECRSGTQALPNDAALEEYTYLVAGCVGEFWTKVCLLEWPNYSSLKEGALLELGRDFGKGLQLVNIVRDFPADLQAGRSYLPLSDPEKARTDIAIAKPEWDRWRARAREYLQSGWKYFRVIRPPRVRFACALPVLIGLRTLKRLDAESEIRSGVKISRAEVQWLTLVAAAIAIFPFVEPMIANRWQIADSGRADRAAT